MYSSYYLLRVKVCTYASRNLYIATGAHDLVTRELLQQFKLSLNIHSPSLYTPVRAATYPWPPPCTAPAGQSAKGRICLVPSHTAGCAWSSATDFSRWAGRGRSGEGQVGLWARVGVASRISSISAWTTFLKVTIFYLDLWIAIYSKGAFGLHLPTYVYCWIWAMANPMAYRVLQMHPVIGLPQRANTYKLLFQGRSTMASRVPHYHYVILFVFVSKELFNTKGYQL